MSESIQIITSDTVKINISNSQNNVISFEKKFNKGLKIHEFKKKLEIITGGNEATMQLELYSGDKFLCKIEDNDAMLGSYPIEEGMRIHVLDNILFEQNVEKFELTENQYENRDDSLRSFLKKNRLGKYNEEEMIEVEKNRREAAEREIEKANSILIGARCKVTTSGRPTRLATVMYKGELEGKKGTFIGVKYDEPLGTNDGSVDGKRYFDCGPKYGGFVKPGAVEVGDFPEEEINFDDEI